MKVTLIKNALIVTMNSDRDVVAGNILIEGDTIQAIAAKVEDIALKADPAAVDVIDAAGQVVIPGLIQAHVHLCQTLFRGQADDLELLDWLQKRIWPLEAAHSYDTVYFSALLGIGELLKCGTTAIVDMGTVHHTEAIFEALAGSGIRALSGKCMMDTNPAAYLLIESTEDSLRESVALLEKWHGYDNGRLGYAFAPRFVLSCSEDLLRRVKALAQEYKVKIHTHASENLTELFLIEREKRMRNIAYYEHLGLTDKDLIVAHCIWLNDEEMEILSRREVKVVHCPLSNLKLGSGIARIPEMLNRNITVALGSDATPCNNHLDIFTEMRAAALIQKPFWGPTAMSAQQTFELATLGGAKAMGLENEIGSLEVGKKADLAMLDLNKIHCSPADQVDIYAKLVYQTKSTDVVLTMVDGRVLYEKGRLTTINEPDTLRQAEIAIAAVKERAGL